MRYRLAVMMMITCVIGRESIATAQDGKSASAHQPTDYCTAAIANLMVDRTRVERQTLDELAARLDAQRQELDLKIESLKQWIGQRDTFRKQARDHVVQLYARMSAEAASTQLSILEPAVASAIISRLEPRVASLILGEMEAGQAARISAMLATVADLKVPREARP
jgi:flagellar motility protein MotE (MotC chaperone)